MPKKDEGKLQMILDPQCKGCRFLIHVGGLAMCNYFEVMKKSRVAMNGGLPMPDVCRQRQPRKRGRPRKGA